MNTTTTNNISNQSIALFKKAIDNLNKKQNPQILGLVNKAYNEYLSQEKTKMIPERPVKPKKERDTEPDIEPVNLKNVFDEVNTNLCIICNVDMGDNNPRQLCKKTYCENE